MREVLSAEFAGCERGAIIANLCLRVDDQMRDGFCLANRQGDEFEEMRNAFAEVQELPFARVPLELVGDLAMAALTADGNRNETASSELAHVARCFVWFARSCTEATPLEKTERLETTAFLTADESRRLFGGGDLETWFLNPEDLAELGVPATMPAGAAPAWFAEQLIKIDVSQQRAYLGRMFDHMATYYRCRGKPDLSRRCRAAASSLTDSRRGREILHAWLEYSFTVNEANQDRDGEPTIMAFGDSARWQKIRQSCFPDLKKPKFRHLAVFDLTEAALIAAEPIILEFATERKPRFSALMPIAHAVAKAWVDLALMTPTDSHAYQIQRRINRAINAIAAKGGLRRDDALVLWDSLDDQMKSFMDQVCGKCPVWCFGRPTGNAAAYFHHPLHPAFRDENAGDV